MMFTILNATLYKTQRIMFTPRIEDFKTVTLVPISQTMTQNSRFWIQISNRKVYLSYGSRPNDKLGKPKDNIRKIARILNRENIHLVVEKSQQISLKPLLSNL